MTGSKTRPSACATSAPPSPPLFSRNIRTSLYPIIKEGTKALRIEPPVLPSSLVWLGGVFAAPMIFVAVLFGLRLKAEHDSVWWLPMAVSPVFAAAVAGVWSWWLDLQRAESAQGPWLVFHRERRLVELPRLGRTLFLNDCIRLEVVSGRWVGGEMPGKYYKLDCEFPANQEIHLIARVRDEREERLFVLYSTVRGKALAAAKAISSATGLQVLEKSQTDPVQ